MNGKGDRPRPFSVPKEQFDKNWEDIFGKKVKKEINENTEKEKQKRSFIEQAKSIICLQRIWY